MGLRMISHARAPRRWSLLGVSQPWATRVSAELTALSRFRMDGGPQMRMSRSVMVFLLHLCNQLNNNCAGSFLDGSGLDGVSSANENWGFFSFCFGIGDSPYFLWRRGLDWCVDHQFFIASEVYHDVDPIDISVGSVGSDLGGCSNFFRRLDNVTR